MLHTVEGDIVEITTRVNSIPSQTATETQRVLETNFTDLKDFVTRAVQITWRKAGRHIKYSSSHIVNTPQLGAGPSEWSLLSSTTSGTSVEEEQLYELGDSIQRSSSRLNCDFEQSVSFFPEQYTANSKIPEFLVAQYVKPSHPELTPR